MEHKITFGFGLVTVLSGIALVMMDQYMTGVCGSIVGLWIVVDNYKKIKAGSQQ